MLTEETGKLKISLSQWIVLGMGSFLVLMLTLFGDRTVLQSNKKINSSETSKQSDQSLIPPFSSQQIAEMEKKLKDKLTQVELPSQKMETLDALVSLGMNNERPDIAAQYSMELRTFDSTDAVKTREALLLKQASDMYENSDTMRFKHWNDLAIVAYENLSAKNPQNLDIQLEYLVRKVKSGNGMNIMSNIQEIKSLADKNPNYTKAQIQLGLLSMQSNQLEKAKSRFLSVIKQNPTDEWALYYMSEIYHRLNQKDSIEWYETEVIRHAKDPKLKAKLQNHQH